MVQEIAIGLIIQEAGLLGPGNAEIIGKGRAAADCSVVAIPGSVQGLMHVAAQDAQRDLRLAQYRAQFDSPRTRPLRPTARSPRVCRQDGAGICAARPVLLLRTEPSSRAGR